jgi:hypothetical protein
MYAERKGLVLQSVEVRLSHERIHAKDCEDCETKEGMLDEIRSEIHLEGDLDQAQRKRLLEIATLCPVHRTLSSEILAKWKISALNPACSGTRRASFQSAWNPANGGNQKRFRQSEKGFGQQPVKI